MQATMAVIDEVKSRPEAIRKKVSSPMVRM
jgi:hypothetical protein